MFLHNNQLLFLSLVLIMLPGCCQKQIRISRSAFADTERIIDGFPEHSAFVILPESEDQTNKLLEKEIGKKISITLENNGYSTVKRKGDANFCLFYTYGMKSETRTINELKYIPGETITTTGTSSGTYGRYNNCAYYGQHQQQSQSSGNFVYIPKQYTFYAKFLTCRVHDKTSNTKRVLNKESKNDVWYGAAINDDLNSDLRGTLDFLIIALFDLFGRNTQEINSITMYEKDEKVTVLRSAYLDVDYELM